AAAPPGAARILRCRAGDADRPQACRLATAVDAGRRGVSPTLQPHGMRRRTASGHSDILRPPVAGRPRGMNQITPPLNDGNLTVTETTDPDLSVTPSDALAAPQTLRDSVELALRNYFEHLDGQDVTDVYNMVLAEVEAPLLESVMDYVRGNQTRASEVLGLNRGTLRKKLKQYGLL